MGKTRLVLRHEFVTTVRRVGFIILTLSLPVVALLGIGIFQIISGAAKPPPEMTRIGYVDQAGGFDRFTDQRTVVLKTFPSQAAATDALVRKEIKEFIVIPADFVGTGVVQRYALQREVTPPPATLTAIGNFLTGNLLAGQVSDNVITRVQTPPNLVTTILTPSGTVAPEQGGIQNFIVPALFGLMLALSIIFSSTYVLQGLGEEKENRLMEILLSSVSTRELVVGKVLGIGAAGLAQVIVWAVTSPFILGLATSSIGGIFNAIQVPGTFWLLAVLYFVMGYLLYAVVMAGVAAVSTTIREGQSIAGFLTIFAVAPFWFVSLLILKPDSPLWVVLSLFPPMAPVLVMLRIGLTGVPAWQLAASLAIMALAIVLGLLVAARLLRTYVLMYGKRPTLGQIIRGLRAS